jgi:glutaredoxin 3
MSRANVIMYATTWCPYCERARRLLHSKGIPFQEIDVEAQPEARAEMQRLSNRRTVPQIFINDRAVGGSDDLHELDRTGELETLLGQPS